MKILLIIFSFIAIFAVIILSAFFYGITQNPDFKEIIKIWANFGDFMGGTLNPILAALSLFGLLFTIYYQNKELEETRKELKKSTIAQQEQSESLKLQNEATKLQVFENTFFKLFNLFNLTKSTLSIKITRKRSGNTYDLGITVNDISYKLINKDIEYWEKYENKNSGSKGIELLLDILKIICKMNYNKFNNEHEAITGTYFGQIYQILKFIDESNIQNKQRYVNIFRAQFTKDEIEFIFYHCLGTIGRTKFKKLVEDYEFLEHIILNNDIEEQLLQYDKIAFGKNEKILNKYNELEKTK